MSATLNAWQWKQFLNNYLIVGALLFTLGLVGFLARRNLIVIVLVRRVDCCKAFR